MDIAPFQTLLAIAAIFALAGLVKGVIGMGLPTVAIGLLGLMMPPAQAAAVLIVPSLISNIWQAVVGGAFRELVARLWPLFAGIVIGTAIGAIWLVHSGGSGATLWLGLALVAYALLGLFKIEFKVPAAREGIIGFACGIATGAITVATGVFAIPMVPYIQGLSLDRHRLVQALGLCFTVCTIALAAALGHAGELNADLMWPSLAGLVAVLVGMRLGQLLRGRIRPEVFRLCFFAGLLMLGGHLALRSVL
ncbi:sulfite exporter TauE/SafE family protein [Undibacter mobilis]|uniref:sulfite exporter TauE/SafE family protein n=1 Tax=Undibacter mobilis TaxID=2292256 RepID=UPI001FE0ACCE|nr:sulfite exporter TauE/SafE family protein [Undibacter mobilis]